jgi:hypothetical protein
MSLYTYDNQDPSYPDKWKDENVKEYKEAVFARISQLLIEKFTEIEPYIEGNSGIKSLQKTIRNQEIQVGIQSEDESIIIYQSDTEANAEDKDIIDAIFGFLNFANLDRIDLTIGDDAGNNEDGIPNILMFGLKNSEDVSSTFSLNAIGSTDMEYIKLKDNVSQFIEIPKTKTEINTNKLTEYEETTFTEIKPETE